jgi:predicted TIM-barrel fold metal-dependent hydrolase
MTEPATTPSPLGITRRSFLAAGLGWLGAGILDADAGPIRRLFPARRPRCIGEVVPATNAAAPLLDIHVHLFGVGEGGTGCRMARSITGGLQFQFLVWALGLREEAGRTLDASYERVLARQLDESGLDAAAIVGQDAVYDRRGQPDWDRTSFFVPNDYVFAVAARHAAKMIPCPSINPDRADALEELGRCHERGARLFKIHPPTQGVDVSDRRHARFFRRCAELDMVVLVHTGHEHSAPVIDRRLAAPSRLELALDQGCTVVACHAGTGWTTDNPDQLPEFVALLRRYPRLWGDTAVLGTAGRVRDFTRLLEEPFVRDRLLHGSDFPFPPAPRAFAARIGDEAAERIERERNWLKKDLDLKQALGVGVASARRAYRVARGGAR